MPETDFHLITILLNYNLYNDEGNEENEGADDEENEDLAEESIKEEENEDENDPDMDATDGLKIENENEQKEMIEKIYIDDEAENAGNEDEDDNEEEELDEGMLRIL